MAKRVTKEMQAAEIKILRRKINELEADIEEVNELRAQMREMHQEELRGRLPQLDKVTSQRIVTALCCMAEKLLETYGSQNDVRHALNRSLSDDYFEIAKLFVPAPVLADAAHQRTQAFERRKIQEEADFKIRENLESLKKKHELALAV